MANMNMIIHDMEGQIELGDTFKNRNSAKATASKPSMGLSPILCGIKTGGRRPTTMPIGEFDRFPKGAGFPGASSADWGWAQIISGKLETQKVGPRWCLTLVRQRAGPENVGRSKERDVRRWFVEHDLIEGVIYLPENLFYNTPAPGLIPCVQQGETQRATG